MLVATLQAQQLEIKPSCVRRKRQMPSLAGSDLPPEQGIIRKPADDDAVFGQRLNLFCHASLFVTAVFDHGRADACCPPIRTPRRAAVQEDHPDCEDAEQLL